MSPTPTNPTGIGPINPITCPEPGCHWACHGVPDKYADSRAGILAEHHAAEHTPTPAPAPVAVWSDGDPLMEAIAAAVYDQCETHPEQALTVDDPRNIAAVAATVARRVLGTPTTHTETTSGPTGIRGLLKHVGIDTTGRDITVAGEVVDRAPLRDRIRRAVCEASGFTWLPDELMEPDEYGEHADAVLAVLPAPAADRATVVWTVWAEDESTLGHYTDEVTAKLAAIEYHQETETPDLKFVYGWSEHAGRLELLANGNDTGLRVKRDKVHGTQPASVVLGR
ncbi:hypothetical protein [[Kitasatospora] papulosa]|uniref:hypothetical protein n=1 Tax=[Kitasatospora] papulosa TaxID=1464011 RepID=UPI0036BB4011